MNPTQLADGFEAGSPAWAACRHVSRPGVRRLLAVAAGILLAAFPAYPQSVIESETEFASNGDFDGDGLHDVILADKATGNYRVGYGLPTGDVVWVPTRATGIADLTGFSVGRFGNASVDAVVVTSPSANRLNRVLASSRANETSPTALYPTNIGPNCVLAMDVGGPGNTAGDDYLIGSLWNSGAPNQLGAYRESSPNPTPLSSLSLNTSRAEFAQRLRIKSGAALLGAFMLRSPASEIFRAYSLGNGSPAALLSLTGLPTNTFFTAAGFNTSATVQFLFYQPSDAAGRLRLRPVVENPANVFSFGAETVFNFGQRIRQAGVVESSGTNYLLLAFGSGETAGLYRFDGITAPTLLQPLTPPEGQGITGVIARPGGQLTVLSGDADRSTHFTPWHPNAGTWTRGLTGILPGLTPLSGTANLFEFEREPFVSSDPNLLRVSRAGDWTSGFNTSSLPNLSLRTETFVSTAAGLDNPTARPATPAHPLTHFGLVNQHLASLSFFSLSRPLGDVVADVDITPMPSSVPLTASIQAILSARPNSAEIRYRLNGSGEWLRYTAPFTLFTTTTVQYFAQLPGSAQRTPVFSAAYRFVSSPGTQDSDGDSVPDYVELAKGLPPGGGADSDGDGASDLDEMVLGSDPADPGSTPQFIFGRPSARRASFWLLETPRVLDGISGGITRAANGEWLSAHTLAGDPLGQALVADQLIPAVTNNTALFDSLSTDPGPVFLAISTETHFAIVTTNADPQLGRELLSLVPLPDVSAPVVVAYNYTSGNITNAATNWIAAAQSAYGFSFPPTVTSRLDQVEVLTALLTEKKIADILVSRGEAFATNLTLFGFRPSDAARSRLTLAQLRALEMPGPQGEPAWSLHTLRQVIGDAVGPARNSTLPLRTLANEIYRLSSRSNNLVPGRYLSPIDTLRTFLWTQQLDPAYAAALPLSQAQRLQAWTAASQTLALPQPRRETNITLVVRTETFNTPGCVLLDLASGPGTRSLWSAVGQPYRLLDTFSVPAGSRVAVRAFADLPSQGCGDGSLQVIAVSLLSVPAAAPLDADGDLLLDDVECFLFGSLFQRGDADFDGDGFSNAQELLDGTDPADRFSHSLQPASLQPPSLTLSPSGGDNALLRWQWPTVYARRVRFTIQASPSLAGAFEQESIPIQEIAAGEFQALLPAQTDSMRFFRLQLTLAH